MPQMKGRSLSLSSNIRKESTFRKAFACLDPTQQRKIMNLAVIQSCLNILDIVAVGLIGLVGSLTVYGVQSRSSSGVLSSILRHLHIANHSFQLQVAILAISATSLFLLKSLLSYIISRRSLNYLSELSSDLAREVLNNLSFSNINNVNSASTQEKLYSITMGTYYLTIGIIAPTGIFLSDILLVILLLSILAFANFFMALILTIFFSLVGFFIYKKLSISSFRIGKRLATLEVQSNIEILEGFKFSRDFALRNSKNEHIDKVIKVRKEIALNQGRLSLLPNITKYIVETSIIISALIVAAIQFLFLDASSAFASLALFLAAGSRIAPAALRVQHALMTIKLSTPGALKAINLLQSQKTETVFANFENNNLAKSSEESQLNANVEISFSEVSFVEPVSDRNILEGISFKAKSDSITVIVGPTGAGKSSILDLIMNNLEPSRGKILIANQYPGEFIRRNPNAVRYVPQNVELRNASVLENIVFSSGSKFSDQNRMQEVLEVTQLSGVVKNLPEGMDTIIGDGGQKLSGGEIQRIGIARAIYDKPKLLLLDEVTSSLDRETEYSILEMIKDLSKEMTIIMVAHRVSNMEIANDLIYLKDGRLIDIGSLHSVQKRNPHLFGMNSS